MAAKIGMVLGSDSDYPYVEKGVETLKKFNIPFEIEVSSAHRTPQRTVDLIRKWEDEGVKVIIAAAGGAAHLPGVVAAHTLLPVLGVPIDSHLSGVDSLYSIVQMPGGIPVGTFGIGKSGAYNAVLFAMEILAVSDDAVKAALAEFRKDQEATVLEKSRKLKERAEK